MKRIIFLLLAVTAILFACEKVIPGFLSDQMRYKDNAVYCKRGLPLIQSDRINTDESTPPVTFKLLNFREKLTGKPAPPEFDKEYEVLVFKEGESFNVNTDTTVAALNKKREVQKVKPMYFNENSGQFVFNKASSNLPIGEYLFDIEATNVWGKRLFEKFGQVTVADPELDDIFTVEDNVSNAFHDVTQVATLQKVPKMTLTRVNGNGARLILKLTDKNGRAFNPKAGEIIKRGDRPVFENYARFNPVTFTDTAMICDFEIAPFPLTNYDDGVTNWNHLMYYRIPSQFATVDNFPAGVGYSVNPRFAFVLKLEGTYILEIRFLDVTKK
ncbi:DUF5007 domain-containing protein [Chitinophaga sp. SYP-B3965]|uniref:DUF5007 domain-containing protein n=1 Tax=Chitinophaga sp. SYP-B3965 TaxID=2663120 RepID=UPI0012998A8B|nr:DUF5007 domain-containing protein [Chitinophaga sp. SYP-B3965]MRG47394.1 DUF5007 domain-containing protein [Chitinophaga sp. SYP-B3965]